MEFGVYFSSLATSMKVSFQYKENAITLEILSMFSLR